MALNEKVKFCVVCGAGSHREDWQKAAKYVACDNHTPAEVKAASDSADKAAAEEAKRLAPKTV